MCDDRNRCAPDECRRIDSDTDDRCDDGTTAAAATLLKRRSKSLSSSILDYYTRYGHNRDLEKYFRYRRHNATTGQRSSSDESSVFVLAASSSQQQIPASTDADTSREVFVSSQSLNRKQAAVGGKGHRSSVGSQSARSDGTAKSSDRMAERSAAKQRTTEPPSVTSRSETDLSSARKNKPPAKNAKMSARSLYSLTSNIEINISNLDAMAERPPAAERQFWRESSATQTSSNALAENNDDSKTTQTAEQSPPADLQQPPAKAVTFSADEMVVEAPMSLDPNADLSLTSGPRPSSANSSIVSMATAANKPRLEWDSLADVGYEKSSQTEGEHLLHRSDGDSTDGVAEPLSTFERATLQKFFNARGMPFDGGNLLAALENACGLEGERAAGAEAAAVLGEIDEEITLTENRLEDDVKDDVAAESLQSPIATKELTSTSTISRLFATADAASTPKPRSVESKSAQTPENTLVSVAVQMSPKQLPMNVSPTFDQQVATDVDDDVASNASSFKFVRGSLPDIPQPQTAVENEENIAATANVPVDVHKTTKPSSEEPNGRSKSRSTRADASAAASSQYDSHTDEIIRTILCSTTSEQSSAEPSLAMAVAAETAASDAPNSSTSRNNTMMQDLQRGIELLDQLVESERLNKATKKRLVKKIVNGLLRAKYNISNSSLADEDDTTLTNTTNISAASKRSAHLPATVKTQPTDEVISPCISRIAHSSNVHRPVETAVGAVATANVPVCTRSTSSSASMQWLKPLTRSEHDYEKHNRQPPKATKESVKLQWIQKEIQQLVSLQDLLIHKQQQSERDRRVYENTGLDRYASTSTDNYYCEVAGGCGVGVGSTAKYNSSTTTYASTKNSVQHQHDRKAPATLVTGAGGAGAGGKHKHTHHQHGHAHQRGAPHDDSSDSPLIVQKFVRNRTKLRTPCNAPHDTDVHVDDDDDDDALNAYARSKQRAFLKQYAQTRPNSSQDERTAARDLIYAHPYGEPPLAAFHRKPVTATNAEHHHMHGRHHPALSNSSGNTFLSSNSVSIPEMRSSSYPEIVRLLREPRSRSQRRSESVAIQTSDSLLKPILKQQRQQQQQQQQHEDETSGRQRPAQPAPALKPVFYTITFDNLAAPPATTGDVDVDADTAFTVQQCLREARPRFLIAANRRRECVRELNVLRKQRNAERQRVFQELHEADDDVGVLCRRLRGMEAPEPLAQRRCFTTRELLAATRQKCRQLPEVRARSAEERQRRERRAQRLLRDVYGRELQRRALRGRVNLSNSVMVAN